MDIQAKMKEFREKFPSSLDREYIRHFDCPLPQQGEIESFLQSALEEQAIDITMTQLQLNREKVEEATIDLVDKHFPKGECQERGSAIVLYAEILIAIMALQKGVIK